MIIKLLNQYCSVKDFRRLGCSLLARCGTKTKPNKPLQMLGFVPLLRNAYANNPTYIISLFWA